MDQFWVNFQCILLWLFPPVYWIRLAVDEVHEFQVDQFVALDFSRNGYMTLLLIKALQTNSVRQQLASPFISKTLKKTIKMIAGKTNSTRRSGLIVVI